MNVRLTVALLFAAVLIFVAPARADSIRHGSSYGMLNSGSSSNPESIGTEFLICFPNTGSSLSTSCGDAMDAKDDLLLQITSVVKGSVQISIPDLAGSTFDTGTALFGLVTCDLGTSSSQLGSVCTPTPTSGALTPAEMACATALGSAPMSMNGSITTITLPASCTSLSHVTFYFDQNLVTPNEFATLSGPGTATPEPSSLTLLGISLISLAFLSKRRLQA